MKIVREFLVALFFWPTLFSISGFPLPTAFAQGTAFTYQGRLSDNGAPANGSYDVQFAVYRTNLTGSIVAGPVTNIATAVNNGLFTATVDLGSGVFTGANYWLEVSVRTNGGYAFMKLVPRQPLTPAPYAIFANSASNLSGMLPAEQLGGTVPLQQLPAEVITNYAFTANLSGTFNGIFNATGGNTVTTNMVKTPFKVVSPTPPPDGDTNWFGPWTPGTTTAGIQEALNSIMPTNDDPLHFYGGEIFVRPGLYLLSQTVQTPVNSVNGTPKANVFLTLVGAGEKASVLCYSNSSAGTVLVLGGGRIGDFNPFNALNFTVRNLGFTSFIDGHTNLLYVNGNNGGVFRGSIENCWFASWYSFTNNDAWVGPPADLVPINVQLNYGGDTFTIARCQFYNVNAIYWSTDHGQMLENFFANSGLANTWPSTSPFSLQAAVVCGEPGSGLPNGNESWVFERNYFEGCNGYVSLAGVNQTPGAYAVSRDDAWESGGTVYGLLSATNSGKVFLFENPRMYATVWTNYAIGITPFALVGPTTNARVADLRTGNFDYRLTAKAFLGSGSGLTFTNAAGAAFRLIVNAATNGFILVPQ